jgi:hypothetical protein
MTEYKPTAWQQRSGIINIKLQQKIEEAEFHVPFVAYLEHISLSCNLTLHTTQSCWEVVHLCQLN